MRKPRAIELFAGVGGFRHGLRESWDVVWSNQWEPGQKMQYASDVYAKHFGRKGHSGEDIEKIFTEARLKAEFFKDLQKKWRVVEVRR